MYYYLLHGTPVEEGRTKGGRHSQLSVYLCDVNVSTSIFLAFGKGARSDGAPRAFITSLLCLYNALHSSQVANVNSLQERCKTFHVFQPEGSLYGLYFACNGVVLLPSRTYWSTQEYNKALKPYHIAPSR